jgi:hypothetical protein
MQSMPWRIGMTLFLCTALSGCGSLEVGIPEGQSLPATETKEQGTEETEPVEADQLTPMPQEERSERPEDSLADYLGVPFLGQLPGEMVSLPGQPIDLGGWMLVPPDGQDWRYSILSLLEGETVVLLLAETIGYTDDGIPIWQGLDGIRLPAQSLLLGETLQGEYYVASSCQVEGTEDGEVFALVRLQDQEMFEDVHQAWRASQQTLQIEEISATGVTCVNPAWGV